MYWAHGDNAGPTLYKDHLYVHRGNAVIAFAPAGSGSRAAVLPVARALSGGVLPDPLSEATLRERLTTEVQKLLDTLSTLLPNSSLVVDGLVKTSLSFKTNWTQAQLKAGYNWQFVMRDGSLGVHNAPFAVGLLKASIADLTGNPTASGYMSASDLQFYTWQYQYFGSATSPNASPNASPAGDGIPNWWETLHFGGRTNALPNTDSDGDSFVALSEFLAGTCPTNGASYLGIVSVSNTVPPAGTGFVVRWMSVTPRSACVSTCPMR